MPGSSGKYADASGNDNLDTTVDPPLTATSMAGTSGALCSTRSLTLPAGGGVLSSVYTLAWMLASLPTAATVYALPAATSTLAFTAGAESGAVPVARISTTWLPAGNAK